MALFDAIKNFFTPETPEPEKATQGDPMVIRVILLLETATYDSEFAPEERAAIERLLGERYELSDQEIHELLALARSRREAVPDIYSFTRELANAMSAPERMQMMTEIWQIIFADGRVDAEEEHFARKMQKLLRLDHPTWIEAKIAARGG
ncbi:MAG: TerB family tellurite resistance protein [Acidobacteriota bacterium]|nr:TerB family tellurite resistance protein [Acidobacteriota bacterium]